MKTMTPEAKEAASQAPSRLQVVANAGGVDIPESVDLSRSEKGDGVEFPVPHDGKGLDETGVHAGSVHHPGVCHGHGQFMKHGVNAAGFEEDHGFGCVNPFCNRGGKHGHPRSGKEDVSVPDQSSRTDGHDFPVGISIHLRLTSLIFCPIPAHNPSQDWL
jgi:hypothetical protein